MLKAFHTPDLIEVGCDEAGRGCLAGPVVAAAVILPPDYKNATLNDSKKLSEKQRLNLRAQIELDAIAFGIGQLMQDEIDEVNILNASFMAMHRALSKINKEFNHILVDGNRFIPYENIKHSCIVKGDGKFLSIAAASVLAKTERDAYMKNIGKDFPQYDWDQNKGYPTKAHRDAIQRHGPCIHHRKSFKLLPDQLKLEF